jgi:hypothetical protein
VHHHQVIKAVSLVHIKEVIMLVLVHHHQVREALLFRLINPSR